MFYVGMLLGIAIDLAAFLSDGGAYPVNDRPAPDDR
jgi:hypothetical protein